MPVLGAVSVKMACQTGVACLTEYWNSTLLTPLRSSVAVAVKTGLASLTAASGCPVGTVGAVIAPVGATVSRM